MQTTEKTLVRKLARIQQFFNRRGRVIFPVTEPRARVELDELIEAIRKASATQHFAVIDERRLAKRRKELRKALFGSHLRPIVAVARARAGDAPALGAIRMPLERTSDITLAAFATSIVSFLGEWRAPFLDEGFANDFLDRLGAAVDAFRAAGREYRVNQMRRTDATRAIAGLLKRGRVLARMLDVLVLTRIGRNVRLRAEWRVVMGAEGAPQARHAA